MIQLRLTEKEAAALWLIVGNGWGDGDFAGYGGTNPVIQTRAMEKLRAAIADQPRKGTPRKATT